MGMALANLSRPPASDTMGVIGCMRATVSLSLRPTAAGGSALCGRIQKRLGKDSVRTVEESPLLVVGLVCPAKRRL